VGSRVVFESVSPEEIARQEPRAKELLNAIERVLLDATYGWANTDALRQLQQLARELEIAAPDFSTVHQKVRSAIGWAEITYSPRKHQKWGLDGAKTVRGFALNEIGGARIALAHYAGAAVRRAMDDES
jgi:hypothetical protein